MAKKTVEENKLSSIAETLIKEYGDGIIFTGSFLEENKEQTITTGLLGLDIALNGGIREGTIVHVEGIPKANKTTMMLTFLAQCQKVGKPCYFIDAEGRLQIELLQSIEGLNISKLNIIRSTADKILTAEEIYTIIENIIRDDPGCVILLDSLAALCPEVELTTEMHEQQRASMPKLTYKLMRKVVQMIRPTKSILITLTHMQANPSGYGSPFKGVGGNAPIFFASYLLGCISSSFTEIDGKKIGKESKFKVSATANGPPGAEPIVYVRFGQGCDKYTDILKIAEDAAVLGKAGAWYTLQLDELKEDGKYPKFQGMENVRTYLKDNPEVYIKLDKHLRTLLGITNE